MPIRPPFRLYSWDAPFLPALLEDMRGMTGGRLGRAVLILPHNRPRRYLLELIRTTAPLPALLPRMVTLQELVADYRAQGTDSPLHTALLLDRVALLHECLGDLAHEDAELRARLSHMDMASFLPWGIRLSSVMEECFTHGVAAQDLSFTDDEVAPFAAALLGALGSIQTRYTELLRGRGWTTPGFDIREASARAEDIPPLFRPSATRHIFIAGFSALGEGERRLFRALWDAGAHICLHTDVRVAEQEGFHWAAGDHRHWLRDWHADAVVVTPARRHRQEAAFCEGYDLHSQLEQLREDLRQRPAGSTAIVLTDNSQLMPVLHHLPDKDVNVSMGYPLARSPLFRLIDSLLRLRHARQEDGRVPWRPLLQCLLHPYLTMLRAPLPDGTDLPLRDAIRDMEKSIRAGSRLADTAALFAESRSRQPAELAPLLDALHEAAFARPGRCATLADMAAWLEELSTMLLTWGGAIWTRFPLDAECLYRLMRSVLPGLRQSSLAETPFPFSVLRQFTTELLQAERVPFELDPITGVQVLGMLETRLLQFDNLYIVNATDDILPGVPQPDPLLPDSLRALLGLPDSRRREMVSAYTLHRLAAGARRIFWYWQEGVQHSTLFDGKKSRSRFVEQRIWQLEQQRGALLEPGTPPLHKCACTVRAVGRAPQAIDATPTLREAMTALLRRRLSPTLLDGYLQCPLRFAWRHLCRLHVPDEVPEGDDPAAVGSLVHAVLEALYRPYLGRTVRRGDISRETLHAIFLQHMESSGLRDSLPVESCVMLETAAPLRLETFLDNQPEETFIHRLEQSYDARLDVRGAGVTLCGQLDRVDIRDGRLHVLDYKTGRVEACRQDVWTDSSFWEALGDFCAGNAQDADNALLQLTAERLHSVQLPCYVHLLAANEDCPVGDAALVHLRDNGAEFPLFDRALTDEELDIAVRLRIPDLLGFLVHHMATAERYIPMAGPACTYCEYRSLCMK